MVPGIDPKVDYAFKRLFGSPHNVPILASLLNAVLRPSPGEAIVELQLLNPFNDKDALDDKLSVVDLKARDQAGRHFTIEMQLLVHRFLAERILYYWARLYQGQMHEGEEFDRLQTTVSVVLLNDVLFRDAPDRHHWLFRLWDAGHGRVMSPHLAIHLFELPKFTRQAGEVGDTLEQWLYFLRHAEELDTDRLPNTLTLPEIHQAMQELRTMHEIDYERFKYEDRVNAQRDARLMRRLPEYEREEARKEGLQEGLQQGLQQGRIQAEFVLAIHLCQQQLGRPLTPADDLYALPIPELQQLAEQLKGEVSGTSPAAPGS